MINIRFPINTFSPLVLIGNGSEGDFYAPHTHTFTYPHIHIHTHTYTHDKNTDPYI